MDVAALGAILVQQDHVVVKNQTKNAAEDAVVGLSAEIKLDEKQYSTQIQKLTYFIQ